jgi:L-ascorbate 6-phosphate lactonase
VFHLAIEIKITMMKKSIFFFFAIYASIYSYSQDNRMIDDIIKHKDGTMIWWVGNNSWIIKSDDLVIATDLFLEERPSTSDGHPYRIVPCPITPEEIASVLDIHFITHGHGDHFNEYTCRILLEKSSCLFVIAESCLEIAKKLTIPDDRIIVAKPREPFEIKGIKVSPLRALHANPNFAIAYYANFQDCGYLLTIDGKTFLQPGDTYLLEDHLFLKEEWGKVKDFHLNVLFVSPTEHATYIDPSVILINTLDPDYIFPQHHGTFTVNETNYWWTKGYPREVYMRLSNTLKDRYHILKPGDSWKIE